MRLPLTVPLLLLTTLVACEAKKPDWARQDRKTALPAEVCKQIDKAVAQLRASRGIDVGDKGDATMPTALWDQMPPERHDDLLRTLAFHASCAAGAQSDAQQVVVHGEDGSEIARRSLSTRVDTGEMMRE